MKLLKILLGAALVAGQQQGYEWEQPSGKIYVDPRTCRSNLIQILKFGLVGLNCIKVDVRETAS